MSFSILRYPGGKGRFAKTLERFVVESKCDTMIEPFAGGAAAGLTLLKNGVIKKLILVELDPRVAAFWIKVRDDKGFSKQIKEFKYARKLGPNDEEQKEDSDLEERRDNLLKELEELEKNDLGMWTLVKNRCSFGGYLDGGLLVQGFGRPAAKYDKSGNRLNEYRYYEGVGSQWNGETLAEKVSKIHEWFVARPSKIEFIQGDALKVLPEYSGAFAFIDPPYSVKDDDPGVDLYQENKLDHEKLFKILQTRKTPWLATYNNSAEVRKLAGDHGCVCHEVNMSRLHADADKKSGATYNELVILPSTYSEERAKTLLKKEDKMVEQNENEKKCKRSGCNKPVPASGKRKFCDEHITSKKKPAGSTTESVAEVKISPDLSTLEDLKKQLRAEEDRLLEMQTRISLFKELIQKYSK